MTSLDRYNAAGTAVTQFFGERKPGRPERTEWREILDGLEAAPEGHAT